MVQQIIERYEHFLRSRRLVKPEQVKFCGYWVRRFLCLARELGEPDFDACLVRFPALLSDSERRPDWQIAQARDAVRIYYHQFRQVHPKPRRKNPPHMDLALKGPSIVCARTRPHCGSYARPPSGQGQWCRHTQGVSRIAGSALGLEFGQFL